MCFDLRNDSEPTAGLILKVGETATSESHTLVLPFESQKPSLPREIFPTWGSYDRTTLIGFHSSPSVNGVFDVGMVPIFGPTPTDWADDVHDVTGGSLFFLRYGLTRHFIYRYPDADPNRRSWQSKLAAIKDTDVDSIAVTLPPYVVGKEIKRTNQTSIPSPLLDLDGAKFYPPTSLAAGGTDSIYLKYELPPNKKQDVFIEQFVKLVIAFIAPGIQLFVNLLRRWGFRGKVKMLIWITASVQLVFISVLVYLAFSNWQESTFKALTDLLIALSSASFLGYVLWKEKQLPDGAQ